MVIETPHEGVKREGGIIVLSSSRHPSSRCHVLGSFGVVVEVMAASRIYLGAKRRRTLFGPFVTTVVILEIQKKELTTSRAQTTSDIIWARLCWQIQP